MKQNKECGLVIGLRLVFRTAAWQPLAPWCAVYCDTIGPLLTSSFQLQYKPRLSDLFHSTTFSGRPRGNRLDVIVRMRLHTRRYLICCQRTFLLRSCSPTKFSETITHTITHFLYRPALLGICWPYTSCRCLPVTPLPITPKILPILVYC